VENGPEYLDPGSDEGAGGQGVSTNSGFSKLAAGLFSLLMIGAVAAPVLENWRTEPQDSFPLSYYPMFSYRRPALTPVTYLVGIDAQGDRRKLHYRHAAGGGMNQVRRQIDKMVRKGNAGELCKTVAGNIATFDTGWRGRIVTIEIRTDTYDLREYFTTTSRTPVNESIHHSCVVDRPKE